MVSNRGQEVTTGMCGFGTDRINWYVIVDGAPLTSIDTGLPGHWQQLVDGVHAFGNLPNQEVLFCGNARMTYDVFKGTAVEPSVLPPTHYNVTEAYRSVQKLTPCGDIVLLSGHGEPWRGDISEITRDRT